MSRPSKDKAYVSAYNKQYNIGKRIQRERLRALGRQMKEADFHWLESDILCNRCDKYVGLELVTIDEFLDVMEPFVEKHKKCK